jgi:hypothetical protein
VFTAARELCSCVAAMPAKPALRRLYATDATAGWRRLAGEDARWIAPLRVVVASGSLSTWSKCNHGHELVTVDHLNHDHQCRRGLKATMAALRSQVKRRLRQGL